MKDFFDQVIEHRTIREFLDKKVEDEKMQMIYDAIIRTPTSNGLQQASVIRLVDAKKKEELAKVCDQEYVKRAPEILIFIADNYRNYRIVEDMGNSLERESDVDIFLQAITDAALMAQNANNLIEAMRMGAVFLGSILNDPEKTIEILGLPERTMPVVGLGFGYPNQSPQLKPRMDKSIRIFEDTYEKFEDYKKLLQDYDIKMTSYYDLRNENTRVDSFTSQVLAKMNFKRPKREKYFEIAKKRGYKLD